MDLIPLRIPEPPADPGPPAVNPRSALRNPQWARLDLVGAFLAARKPTTVRAYAGDLLDFARFLEQPTPGEAVEVLLGLPHGQANAVALGYKADLMARGLAPATVGRRLAALRSLVKLARTLGRVAWTLEVEAPASEKYRDVAGPGREGWRALLQALEAGPDTPKTRRDRALVRLLHDRGLRRGEAVALDLADVEPGGDEPAVTITGKGRSERQRLTINRPTAEALAAWIAVRGAWPGPLFVALDPGAGRGRLTGEAVRRIVRALGRRAGLARPVRPHGLRHAAITTALDLGRDLRDVAAFSRHRDIRVLMVYDDRRRDVGGEIARQLGEV
jgi:integrase/recombinase XerC